MSNEKYNTLAFDFGASSGRAIVGSFDGEKIELSEIHRFPNVSVQVEKAKEEDASPTTRCL